MSKEQSNLKDLKEVISRIAPKLGFEKRLLGFQIHTKWKDIAGEKIAEHTCPSELRAGKLVVLTSSSAWLNELHYLKPKILNILQTLEPDLKIKEITFKLGTEEQLKNLRAMLNDK